MTQTDQHSPSLIQSSHLVEEQALNLILSCQWHIEDAEQLAHQVVALIDDARIVELIPGADRFSARLACPHGYFCLNFEEYSESCWLEAEDDASRQRLATLLSR